MYEYLEGTIVRRGPTSLVMDVGGVGYFLSVPLGTALEEGQVARVWVHLSVREDAHTLYGFSDVSQRDLFRMLLSVRGVGPSVALSMLSGLDASQLVDAIATEDKGTLTSIKGVGKKTADQILLDLGERVLRLASRAPGNEPGSKAVEPSRDATVQDAISALVSIGYKEKDAVRLVEKAAANADELDVEMLIRTALRG